MLLGMPKSSKAMTPEGNLRHEGPVGRFLKSRGGH